MHAILISMGSSGDVFPFLGLGIRLRTRGHRVTLLANEHYRQLVASHSLEFHALVSDAGTDELLGNPQLWHPFKSALVGTRWYGRWIQGQFALIDEIVRED